MICGSCQHDKPESFYFRKGRYWKTCTPCRERRSNLIKRKLKTCTGCKKKLHRENFMREGEQKQTCHQCAQRGKARQHDTCEILGGKREWLGYGSVPLV